MSESCRLRRDEGFVVRSDDGQHRICLVCGEAAALPNAPGGAWPHTPFSGRSPHPLLATIEDERNIESIEDIKFSTRMASADREQIRALAAKAHMSMSDYVTACCLGKRIVVIDEQKELLRQLKGIGSNINRLTVLANMGKVQVIGLDKAARELSEVSAALRAVMEGR
ncbi:MAG: MobC family plasmid mobilization relaxosome protein [Oscillospiraceae bacterium]